MPLPSPDRAWTPPQPGHTWFGSPNESLQLRLLPGWTPENPVESYHSMVNELRLKDKFTVETWNYNFSPPPESSGGEEVRGWRCFFETCWNPCSYPHKNRVPCPSSIQFLCFWTVLGWIFPTWISNVDHITRQILNRLDPSRFFHIQNDPTKWPLIFK